MMVSTTGNKPLVYRQSVKSTELQIIFGFLTDR